MKVPVARVFLKYNTMQLEPALTLNARNRLWVGLVVFLCISISHVFFKVSWHSIAGSPMFHAVNFISCPVCTVFAYRDADDNVVHKLHHKVLLGSANCMLLTIKENKMGPRTVP